MEKSSTMDTFSNSMMGLKFNCHTVSASSDRSFGTSCGIENCCADVLGPSDAADAPLPKDNFDAVLCYLNEILMEEDPEQSPCMYQDSLALQAAEKSFYDALRGTGNSSNNRSSIFVVDQNSGNPERTEDLARTKWSDLHESLSPGHFGSFGEKSAIDRPVHHREDDGHVEERSTKQIAISTEEVEPDEMHDKVLLCPSLNPGFYDESSSSQFDPTPQSEGRTYQRIGLPEEPKRGRPRAGERKLNIREVVDLRGLLTQCAQFVATYDNSTANELLNQIRQHSSPHGDATERLAHCFSSALEARISGMGTTLYTAFRTRRVPAADKLKAYQAYVLACPFQRMSNIYADKSIGKLTKGATTIHIIDFGIHYGFQWPCLVQGVSLRPDGPPKLRITGIDLPRPGFRPAEEVEETGRRLARCCKRFNVPFEYHAIARKWETIRLEDLKIDKSETTVVNCLYRLRHVPDETAEASSPRDTVLNLIKKISPNIFVHGVLNGSYDAPFFVTRFREALHHFSSLFDMFDKTMPRCDHDRFLFEKEVLGRDSMNVVACEGTERVERPETYKQWQVRNQRAGFRQLPLRQEFVKEIRTKVKLQYHKDFLVDEDCNWILLGWKGRILYAISCWKPI